MRFQSVLWLWSHHSALCPRPTQDELLTHPNDKFWVRINISSFRERFLLSPLRNTLINAYFYFYFKRYAVTRLSATHEWQTNIFPTTLKFLSPQCMPFTSQFISVIGGCLFLLFVFSLFLRCSNRLLHKHGSKGSTFLYPHPSTGLCGLHQGYGGGRALFPRSVELGWPRKLLWPTECHRVDSAAVPIRPKRVCLLLLTLLEPCSTAMKTN